MICFNCGYKYSSLETKECRLCGMKFPVKCETCGSNNPIMAKHCFNCGNKIFNKDTESSIENYEVLNENRKNVAVIFADISGFTELSEGKDPEEIREIINECFSYITKPVYELGGTIDKYIGDCIMILFGAKYTHSDDPKRAVICAMKMIEAINDYSSQKFGTEKLKLELSIGINYGLVVTGSVGNYYDKDYTVMGDVVNTAQRLQSIAEKGKIFVSESIYIETKNEINYSDENEISLKNKKIPVKYYQPKEIKMEFTSEKIILDRDYEINFLEEIYNSKKNRCINIIGHKGIGKTILTKNFIKNKDDIKNIWIDCTHNHKNRLNYVISNILLNIMNISYNDTPRIKRNRLISFIDYVLEGYSEEEIERNIDFLNLVMGLERDNEFQNILNSMEYNDIEEEISNQLLIFFGNLIKKYNFIIVIDDTQWCDSKSLSILIKLISNLKDERIFIIFTSRYDIYNLNKDFISKLKLNNLSKDGIKKLSCHNLDCLDIDEEAISKIIEFTNGNPLYIEEFLKKVKRTGKYNVKNNKAYIDISFIDKLPKSIDKIVLENISELNDDTKKLLQIASIIGKDFNLSWIRKFFDGYFDENKIIKSLIKFDMVSLKATHTSSGMLEKIYTFNQDIVREVIYDSTLNKDKEEIHESIAKLIEKKYFKEIENYYEVLCFHYEKANIRKKSNEYYYRTALKYKDDFNYENALEYFLEFINKNEKTKDEDLRLVNSYESVGHIYSIFAKNDKALEYLDKGMNIASLSDDIYSMMIMKANIHKEMGEYNKALQIIDEIQPKIRPNNSIYGKLLQIKCNILRLTGKKEALEIAKVSEEILLKNRDYENLSETMNQAGIIYFLSGDIDNALYYLTKAYNYSEKINNLRNMTRISGNLGIIYHASGSISKALENFNKSIDTSKKILYTPTQITASINLGILYMEKGLFDKSEKLFRYSLQKSKKHSFAYKECITLINIGDLMNQVGKYDIANRYYDSAIEISKKHNLTLEENANYLGISKIYLEQNKYEEAIEILDSSYKVFKEANELASICDYYMYKSIYKINTCNYLDSLKYCEKSIDISIEIKNDMKKLRALRLKGNIISNMDRCEESIKLFTEAINLSYQLESDYELAKSYYCRCIEFYKLGLKKESRKDLLKAKEAIGNVDDCRWKLIIENEEDINYAI